MTWRGSIRGSGSIRLRGSISGSGSMRNRRSKSGGCGAEPVAGVAAAGAGVGHGVAQQPDQLKVQRGDEQAGERVGAHALP